MRESFIEQRKKRIGERRTMNNGYEAEIIEYANSKEVTLRFVKTGVITKNRVYGDFVRGLITHPMAIEDFGEYARATNVETKPPTTFLIDSEDVPLVCSSHWGSVHGSIVSKMLGVLARILICAEEKQLVAYRNGDKADVRKANLYFSDRPQKAREKREKIAQKAAERRERFRKRLGERRIMNNGREAQVVAYRSAYDIDVKFLETRAIATGVIYRNFARGKVRHPPIIEIFGDYARATYFGDKHVTSFLVDTEDLSRIQQTSWNLNGNGYVQSAVFGLVHRFVMGAPKGVEIDHINSDPLDNRKSNLRLCNRAENLWNRRVDKNRKYKGIWFDSRRNRWVAEIKVYGKKTHVGQFDTEEQAALAYNEAAKKYHGEFARLNDIPTEDTK